MFGCSISVSIDIGFVCSTVIGNGVVGDSTRIINVIIVKSPTSVVLVAFGCYISLASG